jgi:hypothetical protein
VGRISDGWKKYWEGYDEPIVQSELHALLWMCIPISTISLCRNLQVARAPHGLPPSFLCLRPDTRMLKIHNQLRGMVDGILTEASPLEIFLNVKNLLCNGLYGTASDDDQNNFFS